jgi:Na+-driven multidrug efflux pump
MVGLVSGGILNIILDPIFIFTLDMGTKGAALATVISQFFSFVLLIIGTTRGENIRIKIKNFSFNKKYIVEIIKGGLPSLSRQSITSVASVTLNWVAGGYGDFAIAAISIVTRIAMFINSAVIGFGQGFQPFCGFNYGAKKYDRVKQGFIFSIKVTTIFLCVMAVLGFIFAPPLIKLFREDVEVVKIGVSLLRFQCLTIPTFGIIVMANMIMQNLGFVGRATLLSIARQGIFFIPLVIALPFLFGQTGLEMTQAVADFLTAICAIPFSIHISKYLKNKEITEENKK